MGLLGERARSPHSRTPRRRVDRTALPGQVCFFHHSMAFATGCDDGRVRVWKNNTEPVNHETGWTLDADLGGPKHDQWKLWPLEFFVNGKKMDQFLKDLASELTYPVLPSSR